MLFLLGNKKLSTYICSPIDQLPNFLPQNHNLKKMTTKEVSIIGLKGKLSINEDGSKIYHNGRLLKQYTIKSKNHSKGYKCCTIENKQYYVHRLVAEAFVLNPHPVIYKMALHKDCNSLNNHYSNLIWGDTKILHQIRVKLNIPGAGVSYKNKEYRGSSTISYEEALKIAKRLDNGETARSICKEYNVSEMSIIRIRKRYCKNTVASPRYSDDMKKIVVELSKKHSKKRVSEITGVNYFTIIKWCKNEMLAETIG